MEYEPIYVEELGSPQLPRGLEQVESLRLCYRTNANCSEDQKIILRLNKI
jgi:hypothetical protein